MEHLLDIRTLSFITVLFSFVYGSGLLCVQFFQKGMVSIRQLGLGALVIGLGFLLLGFRGGIPPWASIIVANTLIFGGFVFMSDSARLFMGLGPKSPLLGLALTPLFLILFLFNTYWAPSVSLRIAWISLFISFQAGLCCIDLIRGQTYDLPFARGITALPFAGASLFFLFRALWALSENTLQTFMSAGVVHQLGFLVINLLILTVSFGFMWMTSSRLEEELRNQARIDTLTRTYNRRALEELSLREMARASRHDLPVSVIMADIDRFKRINDTLGHQAGDMVLAKLANILTDNLRTQDLVARYGGEEFLLLLPDTTLEQAMQTAEKLRATVSETLLDPDKDIKATISLGVAQLRKGEGWQSLVSRADKALYQAKRKGRDCLSYH
jgi:diguanylate cyclase (GGDEF)-like protein